MPHRKKLIIFTVIAAVLGAGYVFRVDIAVKAIGVAFRWSTSVGPNIEIAWDKPTEAEKLKPGAKRPPNIVVILTDDMGFNDVSFYGGGMVQTPHIDALAREGVNFRNGYAGSAVCAVSRVALLTGRYSTRSGFEFTPTPDQMGPILKLLASQNDNMRKNRFIERENTLTFNERGMPPSEVTVAELLQQANYHTVHIGKWHLGREKQFMPNAQGFDESLFMSSGLYLPVDSPDVVNSKQDFDPIDRVLWNILSYSASFNGGEPFAPRGYLTDYYTEEAVKVIENNKDRPFLLYLAHWGIHTPLQAKRSDYDALADDIADPRARVYGAMIKSVDRSVGAVMQALKDNGLDEDTIVIFTSDNGGANYIGLPEVNKPYRGWKLSFFEGGTHVPFFARWPGKLPAGTNYPHPVSHMDIMPTALAAAGVTYQPETEDKSIDGVNLLPHAQGTVSGAPHDFLVWRTGSYQAILADGWKLHVTAYHEPDERLFHISVDPTEQRDVAAQYPDKIAELKALLATHNAQQVPPLWESNAMMPITVDKTLDEPMSSDDDYIYWQN